MSITRWNLKVPNYGVGKVLGYINAAGDIEALTVSSSAVGFPLSNVVFVDQDAAVLSAQGMLAYTTLEDAYTSWRAGGDAFVAYGAPSATNPALILIGIGTFTPAATITHDVPYLTVSGCTDNPLNHEITYTAGGPLFDQTVDNAKFMNLRLTNKSGASETVFQVDGGIGANSLYYNIDGSASTGEADGNYFVKNSSGNISGKFLKLKLYSHQGHGLWNGTMRSLLIQDMEIKFVAPAGGFPFDCDADATVLLRDVRLTGSAGDNADMIANNGGNAWAAIMEDIQVELTDLTALGRISSNTDGISGIIRNMRGIGGGLAVFTSGLCAGQTFHGVLERSSVGVTNANTHAIVTAVNARYDYNRILGTGTGLAISGAVAIEAAHNQVRNPTGDVAGSWTNSTVAANSYNVELLAATTS